MKTNLLLLLAGVALIGVVIVLRNLTTPSSSSSPSASQAIADNPALQSHPQDEPWWMARHQAIVSRILVGDVDLIFLGDSIFQNFEKNRPPDQEYTPIWTEFYGDRHAVNMSFSGDETGNVLWRLENGEIQALTPKLVVLLIGTNNTIAKQTAQQTTAGIESVVDLLLLKLANVKVLVLGILPGDLADAPGKTAADSQVNEMLASDYAGRDDVTFLDISSVFLKDGKVDWSLYIDPEIPQPDGEMGTPLHPNPKGQRLLAQAIEPTLSRLMGDANKLNKRDDAESPAIPAPPP